MSKPGPTLPMEPGAKTFARVIGAPRVWISVWSAGILPAGRAASCRPLSPRRLEAADPAAWKAALQSNPALRQEPRPTSLFVLRPSPVVRPHSSTCTPPLLHRNRHDVVQHAGSGYVRSCPRSGDHQRVGLVAL